MFRACVVDDHEETAEVLTTALEEAGFEVRSGHTGEEALKILEGENIDVLLLDVNLPDMTGFDVCRQIKHDASTAHTAVIFLTVNGERADIAQGFMAGAVDYLTKPYHVPTVVERVKQALSSHVGDEAENGGPLEDPAYTDQLTGLRNRRFLLERLQEEVARAHRYNFPVSCVFIELDEVEAHDPELGPAAIDDLIAEVALAIKRHTRSYDILSRYEGTTFAAVLPHAGVEQATQYAEKIMRDVDATTFSDPGYPTRAALSIGIACCQNGSAQSADYVLGETLRNLFQAKGQPSPRLVAKPCNGH